jgi:hypothetical protein
MTLDLQVATRNKVNAKANYVSTYLQSLLSNYFEKKVVKFTPYKTWTAQIKKEIEELQQRLQDNKFRIVFHFGYGNVSAEIDTTFSDDGGRVRYVKQHFYVARFNSDTGALTEVYHVDSFRTDYTAQEITDKSQKLSELDKIARELKFELSRFY